MILTYRPHITIAYRLIRYYKIIRSRIQNIAYLTMWATHRRCVLIWLYGLNSIRWRNVIGDSPCVTKRDRRPLEKPPVQ